MILAAVASDLHSPVMVVGVAALLGASYGVCVVAGLIIAQSLATPRDLAGITGVYYSLSYLGFLLPTILAALTPVLPYTGGLVIVAGICALCLMFVGDRAASTELVGAGSGGADGRSGCADAGSDSGRQRHRPHDRRGSDPEPLTAGRARSGWVGPVRSGPVGAGGVTSPARPRRARQHPRQTGPGGADGISGTPRSAGR